MVIIIIIVIVVRIVIIVIVEGSASGLFDLLPLLLGHLAEGLGGTFGVDRYLSNAASFVFNSITCLTRAN